MKADRSRVLTRRRAERAALLGRAEAYVRTAASRLDVRAAVVVGSVARGDFNAWSDIDLLVVAEGLPDRVLDRAEAAGPSPGLVSPVLWTVEEWTRQLGQRNLLAVEALERGAWLVGGPDALAGP